MAKITPHLWFDKEAKEAAEFYTSLLPNSKITSSTVLNNTPSGDNEVISFQLVGQPFMAISAGPYFKFNPSISFFINFDPSRDELAKEKIDEVWNRLVVGGKILMDIGKYPFSERYGWLEDKYGLSWQLILTNPEGEERPPIIPSLLFTGAVSGRAEEASDFYLEVFKGSRRGTIARYPAGMESEKEGTLMFTDFQLLDTWFVAMDSAQEHGFTFNEAVSLIVYCDDQEEIDYYWEKLSAVPEAEQCGWLKDKFGVSWQITPRKLGEMMNSGDQEQRERLTQAFLKMKKFDLSKLEEAYGREV